MTISPYHLQDLDTMQPSARDHLFMSRALQLARLGVFTAHPNPRVGCVLVKANKILGEGWHKKAGEPHAEVHALNQAGLEAKGACAYVTLEPCSHTGRTGPCAQALVEAGVSRVVVAMQDPNPLVSGKGIQILRDAGIAVEVGVLENEARNLNRGFIKRMQSGLPWVYVKTAMSLDGRTAMASGESQWITGAAARADVQTLRAQSSAIISGIGTVLCDNPSLTVREPDFALGDAFFNQSDNSQQSVLMSDVLARPPLRVIMDSSARLSRSAKLLDSDGPILWVISDQLSLTEEQDAVATLPQVQVLRVPMNKRSESLLLVLNHLGKEGCNEVMVESGSELVGQFTQAGLVDELIVYMAPKLMGSSAMPMMNFSLDTMSETKLLCLSDVRQIGDDLRLTYQTNTNS